jgi:pimeloyl-ACP methyl ester carboxylesterase
VPSTDTRGAMPEHEPPRRGRGRSCLWPLLLIGLSGLALLLVVGVLFEQVASRYDWQRYPPPGRLIATEGHRLHLHCTGEGSPVVLVEAGHGMWSLDWQPVRERFTASRFCAYDRAGYGWSDAASTSRAGDQIVAELRALLHTAGEEGPFVLVGHLLGGMYVRLYAATYPDDVAALVLVDPRHEAQSAREPPWLTEQVGAMAITFGRMAWLARVGLGRLVGPYIEQPPAALPSELHPTYRAHVYQAKHLDAAGGELLEMAATEARLQVAGTLTDRPLRLIVRSEPMLVPPEMSDNPMELDNMLRELEQEYLRLSSRSSRIVADQSGHLVHLDRPDVVAEVLDAVVAEVREFASVERPQASWAPSAMALVRQR